MPDSYYHSLFRQIYLWKTPYPVKPTPGREKVKKNELKYVTMRREPLKPAQLLLAASVALICISGISGCHTTSQNKGSDSLDLSARDTTVNPAEDFFRYANGTWLDNTEIPAEYSGWGAFMTLRDKVSHQLKDILDSCATLKNPKPGSEAQQIGDLYASDMDSTAIEKAGLTPLTRSLTLIDDIKTPNDLIGVVSSYKVNGYGAPSPFGYSVDADQKNSDLERLHFYQGGLGLPNKTYYFKTDSAGKAVMNAYHGLITRVLALSGEDSSVASGHAADIISLETKLAAASKSPVELRDPNANYHLLSVNEAQKLSPQLRWDTMLKIMQVKLDTLLMEQPEFFKALSGLLATTPIGVWQEYLKFHLINQHSNFLSSPYFNAGFTFSQALSGAKQPLPRWQRASNLVKNRLGDALGKIYVEKYFPPSAKTYMEQMVDNLKAAFKEHIEDLDWMSDSTKAFALEKLNAMVKKIGYPEKWKDYSSIKIDRSSLIDNLRRIRMWRYQFDANKLGKPVDRSEWFMTAPTVNAYYNPTANDINFPAGFLQPPYYFQHGDDAINYGAIGVVIGHEMTHGFDDEGSQFDKEGNLKSWWTRDDRRRFDQRAERIIKQFDQYTILDTVHLNGKLTEGENIADLGGLAIAYSAFQKTAQARSDTLIDGLTAAQRFFLSYAQGSQVKWRPQIQATFALSDTHSPAVYRVNGPLSNMPAFYKVFQVKPGDKMYRNDSVRVEIW